MKQLLIVSSFLFLLHYFKSATVRAIRKLIMRNKIPTISCILQLIFAEIPDKKS